MLKLEEQQRERTAELSEFEKEDVTKNNSLLDRATLAMEEELDDVKHMNQMMLYAKCATIREAQIKEKEKLRRAAKEEEIRQDREMMAYLEAQAKRVEEREQKRTKEQKDGAKLIVDQIVKRENDRIRLREQKEQEARAVVEEMKKRQEIDIVERGKKHIEGKKLLKEILDANNAAIAAKERKRQEEIAEDLRIAEYIRAKEAREAEKEAEAKRIQAEKDNSLGRLADQIGKQQDRQAALDELRAKRYQESRERKLRERDRREKEKKQKMIDDMMKSCESQKREKERLLAEQAIQEKAEYDRVLQWQKEQTEEERRNKTDKREEQSKYRDMLMNRIVTRENEKKESRRRFIEEGKKLTSQMKKEEEKLASIKERKLQMLEKAGVPEKYRAELVRYRVLSNNIFA